MIDTDARIVFMPLYKSLQKPVLIHAEKVQEKNGAQENAPKEAARAVFQEASNKKDKIKKIAAPKKDSKKTKKNVQAAKPVPKPVIKKIVEPVAPKVAEKKVEEPIQAPVEHSAAENTLLVGQQEMNALMQYQEIQAQMKEHWAPPLGMSPDLVCVIVIAVDKAGAITQMNVEKSSGVLLFDTAARKAVKKIVPPEWAYGKEISLTFKI